MAANSCERGCSCAPALPLLSRATRDATSRDPACVASSPCRTLCSLRVLLVPVVLVRSGLPVPAVLALVLVLFVLVLVLFVPAVVVLTVLAVLVLVCSRLIAGTFCAASGPTRPSSSSVASIARGAPCWRRWVPKQRTHAAYCGGRTFTGG